MYGIYSIASRRFCFDIAEPTKRKALQSLVNKIGREAYKWRFEVRQIKNDRLQTAARKKLC